MANTSFTDQDMITDVLSTQKFITGEYNNNANEAKDPAVKNTLMSILDDEHMIQHEVFQEMEKRGWYPTEAAPQNKIDSAKQKFAADCKNCCCHC